MFSYWLGIHGTSLGGVSTSVEIKKEKSLCAILVLSREITSLGQLKKKSLYKLSKNCVSENYNNFF